MFANVINISMDMMKKLLNPLRQAIAKKGFLIEPELLQAFYPNSAGGFAIRRQLSIQSINQTFPFYYDLLKALDYDFPSIYSVDEFCELYNEDQKESKLFKDIFNKFGSDKASTHDYYRIYSTILSNHNSVQNLLEVGLGTNNIQVASNMGKFGKPGASLRSFKEFLPKAFIYGADIDKGILFEEDRIKTFFVDQTKPETFVDLENEIKTPLDIIIDDGLHSPNANLAFLNYALRNVNDSGWIIIEDILSAALPIWQVVGATLAEKSYNSLIIKSKSSNLFIVIKN